MKAKVIVAIDLGEVTTAASKYYSDGSREIMPLEIHGKLHQPTALASHPDRGFLVGIEAIRTPGATELSMRFKIQEDEKGIFRFEHGEFIRALKRHWLTTGQLSASDQIEFLVSAPFGMTASQLDRYRAAFLCSEVSEIQLVSESRATVLQAKETMGLTTDEAKQNVLIINIGGKTIETGCLRGLARVMEFARPLGCDPIDENLLEYLLAGHPQHVELRALLLSDSSLKMKAINLAREIKEEYFNYAQLYNEAGAGSSIDIACRTEVLGGIAFQPHVTAHEMRSILDLPVAATGKGWLTNFKEFLAILQQSMLSKKYAPDSILLTGGGSRMDMVAVACSEVFPTLTIRRDGSPETVVSNGMARWARVRCQTERFRQETSTFCDTETALLVEQNMHELDERILRMICTYVVDAALVPVRSWRDGSIPTLAATEEHIRAEVGRVLASRELQNAVSTEVEAWFVPLRREILVRAERLCSKYQIEPEALHLDCALELQDRSQSIDSMPLTTLLDPVLAAVGLLLSIAAASMAGGAGIALIMAGPGGLLIGFLVAASVCFYNRESGRTWLYNANVPVFVRRIVTDEAIAQRLQSLREQCSLSLRQSFEGPITASLQESIVVSMRQELTARLQQAEFFIR